MEIVNIDIFNKRRSMGYGEADYGDLKDANGLRLTTRKVIKMEVSYILILSHLTTITICKLIHFIGIFTWFKINMINN